jgi:hypothetical protein
MTIKDRFEAMKKSGAEVQRPLELFGELDARAAAVAMDSSPCVLNNAKMATVLSSSAQALEWLAAQAEF